MKWTDEKIAKLKELCFAGVATNKSIAIELGCSINDVYNKRSQLGITIDKCKAKKEDRSVKKEDVKTYTLEEVRALLETIFSEELILLREIYKAIKVK